MANPVAIASYRIHRLLELHTWELHERSVVYRVSRFWFRETRAEYSLVGLTPDPRRVFVRSNHFVVGIGLVVAGVVGWLLSLVLFRGSWAGFIAKHSGFAVLAGVSAAILTARKAEMACFDGQRPFCVLCRPGDHGEFDHFLIQVSRQIKHETSAVD